LEVDQSVIHPFCELTSSRIGLSVNCLVTSTWWVCG